MSAVGLGALIGVQREFEIQQFGKADIAGLRTFVLISILGALAGYLSFVFLESYTLIFVGLIILAALTVAGYVITAIKNKEEIVGITTEVAVFLTFILGMMCVIGYRLEAVIITIIIVIFLALKKPMHEFVRHIKVSEVYATLKFAVITLLVLPFLPNVNYSLMDIPLLNKLIEVTSIFPVELAKQLDVFNPFKVWLLVVFISGISFVGYILIRIIGTDKGLGVTGVLGGIASSTALTSSISLESRKKSKIVIPFVMAVIVGCSTMFIRVLVEILVVNPNLLKSTAIPMLTMGISGFVFSFVLWKMIKTTKVEEMQFNSPFTLGPALKFGLLFLFVLVISKLGSIAFGAKGVYLAAFIAGLADIDAITLSMATIAAAGGISSYVAAFAITIAAITNTAVKAGITYLFGGEEFRKRTVIIFAFIILLGLLSVLLFLR